MIGGPRLISASFSTSSARANPWLPVVKSSWQPETVTYQAEMVSHHGSLFQAKRDTAQSPGGPDWICIARHGVDAITPTARGAYNVNDSYTQLDIVSFDGAVSVNSETSRHSSSVNSDRRTRRRVGSSPSRTVASFKVKMRRSSS